MARNYNKRYGNNTDWFINGIFKAGKAMASAYEKEQRAQSRKVAAYNRLVAQNEREQLRQIKQQEMATRRAEREREKAEKARERALKLQAKIDEQQRFEEEVSFIEEENKQWTNVHKLVEDLVTIDEVREIIERCDFEVNNNISGGYFKTAYPEEESAKKIAQSEADSKFPIAFAERELAISRSNLYNCKFEEEEPTEEIIKKELESEAKSTIKAFFPWKQSKLRKEYINEHLEERLKERHESWDSRRMLYLSEKKSLEEIVEEKNQKLKDVTMAKESFTRSRTKELYDEEIKTWENERKYFYDSFRQNLQDIIEGNKDYVISVINSIFPNEDLPLDYFVDFVYEKEKGRVLVDLDLPEIEDIPERKIISTPTGKKSIRMKSQTDLRSDYANCVFGLAIYVAYKIFNISVHIQNIEISGFTQRKETNSAVATDQYIFIVNFTRDLFSTIDFNNLSSIQAMDFFHRHFNMTKGFDMKQIDLASAYTKMETFNPANYEEFMSVSPKISENISNSETQENKMTDNSSYSILVNDTPIETYEKSSSFASELYAFIDKLSKDKGVNRHSENMNGVTIRLTNGRFEGDADTNTYRGKLFFCGMVDLYRSLEKMRINMSVFTPSCYPFSLMLDKIYIRKGISYNDIDVLASSYISYCQMLKQSVNSIPIPSHFFLLGEVLFDYEQDLSWYEQYMSLMIKHAKIIQKTVQDINYRRVDVDNFLNYIQGIYGKM